MRRTGGLVALPPVACQADVMVAHRQDSRLAVGGRSPAAPRAGLPAAMLGSEIGCARGARNAAPGRSRWHHVPPWGASAVQGSSAVAAGWWTMTRRMSSMIRYKQGICAQEPATTWASQNSSRPSRPPSRPKPDSFMPPKGASGVGPAPVFRPTWPKRSWPMTRSARAESCVKM